MFNHSIINSGTGSPATFNGGDLYDQITTSDSTYKYSYDRDLSYDAIMAQVADPNLPIIDNETWEKVSTMLSSNDIELIKLGFQLMSGYRFPPGVMNLIIIHKAINKCLTEINNN
jgi:hypothetical protein